MTRIPKTILAPQSKNVDILLVRNAKEEQQKKVSKEQSGQYQLKVMFRDGICMCRSEGYY